VGSTKVWYIIPASAIVLFVSGCVSETELEIQSEKEFEKMRSSILISNDAGTRSYINCVADAIIAELDEPYASKDWEVEIFESEQINAFAMPGGKIGVFTGILEVAENPNQLAAVLGHEVAHVTEQHSLEQAQREMGTQVGVIGITTVLGGGGDLIGAAAMIGLSLPYGRKAESEADTVGLRNMAAAGFDPRASTQLWKNMGAKAGLGPAEFLSTHPSNETRIADLVRQWPAALVLYNEARDAGKKPNCRN